MFGVLGMVVGVPIFAVFYAGVKAIVNRKLAKKNFPTESQLYMTVGQVDESMTFTEYVPPVKVKKKKTKEEKSSNKISGETTENGDK